MLNQLTPESIALLKQLRKDATTSGISSSTGLNFYNLEPAAKNIYPVFYPILSSIPRTNPMFNGQRVGGTAVNWKAITQIDPNGYPSLSEGNRNAYMSIVERDYSSAFKMLGKDVPVTFFAQETGRGFDDSIGNAQLALLNALLNDEERMALFGNSGPSASGGSNGFALGTTPTPVLTQNADTATGQIGASAQNAVYCVALTAWGAYMAGATGVKLPFLRNNADGSTDVINGGTAKISAISNSVVTDATHTSFTAKVVPVAGAVAYAWFISQNATPTIANSFFSAVTPFPTAKLTVYNNTNQAANAADANTGKSLSTDYSYNNLDFDGLMTWTAANATASSPSYWKDLNGAGFTANGDGSIAEFEDVADFLWKNYKASVDKIYLGGTLTQAVSKAILASSAGGAAAQRIVFESDNAGKLVGGTKVAAYRWKYSLTGAPKVIEITEHPWIPDGVVYFDIVNNPYPAAGGAIPSVRRIVSLEDHFSIKWPYRSLKHELGVYCFETMQHYLPFASGMITGAANKVN